MASLAESLGFLFTSTFAPVSNGQTQDFSNTRPGFICDADHELITEAQASGSKTLPEHTMQLQVIDGMRLPGLMNQLKVVVREKSASWLFGPAPLRHPWAQSCFAPFFRLNPLQKVRGWICQWMRVEIPFFAMPPSPG